MRALSKSKEEKGKFKQKLGEMWGEKSKKLLNNSKELKWHSFREPKERAAERAKREREESKWSKREEELIKRGEKEIKEKSNR